VLTLTQAERQAVQSFLAAWLRWVHDGALSNAVFSRHRGLCGCARVAQRHNWPVGLTRWLGTMLEEDYGTEMPFPFGETLFQREVASSLMHINTQRVRWAQEKIAGTGYDPEAVYVAPPRVKGTEYDPFDLF
jgi:hypothetical protein